MHHEWFDGQRNNWREGLLDDRLDGWFFQDWLDVWRNDHCLPSLLGDRFRSYLRLADTPDVRLIQLLEVGGRAVDTRDCLLEERLNPGHTTLDVLQI